MQVWRPDEKMVYLQELVGTFGQETVLFSVV